MNSGIAKLNEEGSKVTKDFVSPVFPANTLTKCLQNPTKEKIAIIITVEQDPHILNVRMRKSVLYFY